MTIQEQITQLETQMKDWQTRRTQAADALSEAQSAILQLQGALAFARSLLPPEERPMNASEPADG